MNYLEHAFIAYHRENPHVYEQLRELALRAKASDYQPGIGCLFEVLRYRQGVKRGQGEELLRLNNNFRAYYARMLEEREPELQGFFKLRRLRAA